MIHSFTLAGNIRVIESRPLIASVIAELKDRLGNEQDVWLNIPKDIAHHVKRCNCIKITVEIDTEST